MKALITASLMSTTLLGPGIDKEFVPHVESFVAEWKGVLPPLVMKLAPELADENWSAVCYQEQEPRFILFSESFWVSLDPIQKEHLVFHELGHCVLDRIPHMDDKNIYDTPVSIMYFELNYDLNDCYAALRQDYLTELFTYEVPEILWEVSANDCRSKDRRNRQLFQTERGTQ